MTDQELKKWFWDKFNSCYCVKHDDFSEYIFMYYDKDFIRKSKFRILQGKDIVYPTKPIGICLFEQDHKNEWLRCDYDHIWAFFESNCNYNYQETKDLIKGWLEEDTKLKVLTPINMRIIANPMLEEDTKLKVLTPSHRWDNRMEELGEESKLKVLTPRNDIVPFYMSLEEDTKLKVLTKSYQPQ